MLRCSACLMRRRNLHGHDSHAEGCSAASAARGERFRRSNSLYVKTKPNIGWNTDKRLKEKR